LTLVKERAERDKQEREALESLKMTLEAQKRKVEEELEAERAVALDKESLLERSKKREGELEEEVALLQADLETLDSQLDRAMKIQKESEEKHEALRRAFDEAAEHLVRLENEQKVWAGRETELVEQLSRYQAEVEALCADRDELSKEGEQLKSLVSQREEDLARIKERMEAAVNELNAKLTSEARQRLVPP
jgi:myosin protein heavy chain